MNTDTLFPLEEPGLRRTRRDHSREVEEMKKMHGIFTHQGARRQKHGDWLAMSMPACIEALSGHELTELEKQDGVVLLGGYCRLLDEAGLIHEGYATEREAVLAAISSLPNAPSQRTSKS